MQLIGDLFHYLFQEPIYNLLMLIYGIIHSFWLSIVVMTLLLRTALVPLVFRQLRSTKVMQELQPQIQKIQREYRAEPLVMQQKLSALYKEHNYNPYASCLPLLIQLPFIYGLYGAFNSILRGHPKPSDLNDALYPFMRPIFGPNGLTHLPDTHFLAISLAQADPTHILPILAALLTFIQLRMSLRRNQNQMQTNRPAGAPDPNAATVKMMQYIMPLFTLFIAWSFPSGLALYWIVTTAYSVVQQYFFNGRNFGGLFEGIPGLEHLVPQPQVAVATPNGSKVVDSTLSAPTPGSNHPRARVVEEKTPEKNGSEKATALRALPAANDTPRTTGTANRPAPRPAAKPATTRTPTTPNARKGSVRLVTPQANGASSNGSVPVTHIPKMTTSATPRVSTVKPKPSSTTRPKKKGGK